MEKQKKLLLVIIMTILLLIALSLITIFLKNNPDQRENISPAIPATSISENNSSNNCVNDNDCKLIYNNCECAAALKNSENEIQSIQNVLNDDKAICKTNLCINGKISAVCKNKKCMRSDFKQPEIHN